MRIAITIQRYGAEVLGGAEHLCRLVAERLATQHDVEVLTSCARDYVTWKNEYPEGSDRIRGVTVRRFATAHSRDINAFNRYSEWLFTRPHTRTEELEWLRQQGPWCPGLIDHLRRQQHQYDVLVFFTYLYAPTVLGLEVNPAKSVLVPTAHDEPAIGLEIFQDVFTRPAAICYLTESEKRFVQGRFPDRPLLEEVVGVGVDIPQPQPYPRMPPPESEARTDADPERDDAVPAEEPGPREFPSHLTARGAVFRRRHRLHGPLLLYGGRIDPGKGCEELIEYFRHYINEGGNATLALMGVKMMSLPEDPFIRFAGLLSERERFQALEAATVVVCPSPYESLSLLALESMSSETPILANARSAVLVEHCVNSNGGLYYADRDEFAECLHVLLEDAPLRAALGKNGRDYVRRNFRWDIVLGKYERTFARVRNAR
jgi:glycosyltransferase involved in cell wall biosynthesis